MENTVIQCPHCQEFIIVEKLNCGIFRHGVLIQNGEQIPPHLGKPMCDELAEKKLIYGCGKPFKISKTNESTPFSIEICDYI